jgi:hypothetical protein
MGEADSTLIWVSVGVPLSGQEIQEAFSRIRVEGVRLQAMSVTHYSHDNSSSHASNLAHVTTDVR